MKKWIRLLLDIICIVMLVIFSSIAILYAKGVKPSIMISGSMNPLIPIGSLCFVDTKHPYSDIEENDIIMYQVPNQHVIHRVVGKRKDGYMTKGDANKRIDRAIITPEIYLGKFLFSIPQIGYFIVKLQGSVAKAIFITIFVSLYVIDYLMHYAEKNIGSVNQQKTFSN